MMKVETHDHPAAIAPRSLRLTTTGSGRYRIRVMTGQEVVTAIEWAAAEGWNPGWHDAECFRAADPEGFLVGLLDDEPVATISVVKYGTQFGFLGLYIVKPAHRGRGYGLRLWNEGLAYLGRRTIGLDGVVAQQANYRKSGFELAYRNVRYQAAGGIGGPEDARVVPLSSVPFGEVNAYDRSLFPADRAAFLKGWIRQPQGTAIGILRKGKLAGYGVIRAARSGFKIGPLFADDQELAEALLKTLAAFAGEAPVFLDAPEINPAAIALAKRHGMTVAFETARMYIGRAPDLPMRRVFGVTTFELG
jgi:ribosomal protein S18 acetylase RimI-like enzyme